MIASAGWIFAPDCNILTLVPLSERLLQPQSDRFALKLAAVTGRRQAAPKRLQKRKTSRAAEPSRKVDGSPKRRADCTADHLPAEISIQLELWTCRITWRVGGLEHFLFSHRLGIIIPTDFHIFQRGRSTTNQMMCCLDLLPSGVMGARLSSKIPLGHHDMDKPTSLSISGSSKTLDHQKPWSHFWITKNHDLDKPHENSIFSGMNPPRIPIFIPPNLLDLGSRDSTYFSSCAGTSLGPGLGDIQWLLVEQMFLQGDLYW